MSTILRPAPRTLADVRDPDGDDTYPVDVLSGCRTALVLFAAAWHGRQDAVHIADAGLDGWCVDTDARKLAEMSVVYPFGWQFITADVFKFTAETTHKWDVLSADPFTNLFVPCAALLPLWCSLAKRVVILGCGPDTEVEAPEGWQVTSRRWRSDFNNGVEWATVERDEEGQE